MQFLLANARRVVVKLGTNILTSGIGQLDVHRIGKICEQIGALREKGLEVIIVSSGSIGLGMGQLGLRRRPVDLPTLQACAAIGQTILIQTWQNALIPYQLKSAQILFTNEDLRSRKRHVGARDTLEKLLSLGIIPIINENDSVSVDEIKFGDNDILSSLVASLTKADMLFILSTIPGLLDRNSNGRLVPVVEEITPGIEAMAGDSESVTSVGGMRAKIEAAKIATKSGCGVFIGSGRDDTILLHVFGGSSQGTFFIPQNTSMQSRKRWIAFFDKPKGSVTVDDGARNAILEKGSSLLAKGITGFAGNFQAGHIIDIKQSDGMALARGISQFASHEIIQILGKDSEDIRALFPERKKQEVIHRDSLVRLR